MGFALVLLLTVAVAVTGWNSLSGVVFRVDPSGDMNTLVNAMLNARLNDLEFGIERQATQAQQVNTLLDRLEGQAREQAFSLGKVFPATCLRANRLTWPEGVWMVGILVHLELIVK